MRPSASAPSIRPFALTGWHVAVILALGGCGDDPADVDVQPESTPCAPSVTLDLLPGEAAPPASGTDLCVAFTRAGRYAVAFFDTAGVAIETTRGHRFDEDDLFALTVRHFGEDGPAAESVPRSALLPGALPPAPPPEAARTAEVDCSRPGLDPWCRTRPWELGDRFDFRFDEVRTAEIVAVVDGMALAYWVDDLEVMAEATGRFLRLARASADEVIPFLRENLLDVDLETGPGTGQLLILARPENVSYALSRSVDGGSREMLLLGLRPAPSDELRHTADMQTMAHELGHLWQFAHLYRVPGGTNVFTHPWAIEGGADFIAKEFLRQRFGIPTDTERENWVAGVLTEPADVYWNQLHSGRGDFEQGYYHAEPFFRDLLIRQLHADVPYDEAFRNMVLGAMEGWAASGGDPDFAGEGLRLRLARALGDGDVTRAVLRWTLSNALDDRTSGTTFQNHTFASAWRVQDRSGWPPVATLLAGGEISATRPAGSTGYIVIHTEGSAGHPVRLTHEISDYGPDPGPGGPARVGTGIRWMVARID